MWKQCQEGVSGASCTTGGSSFLSWDAAQSAAGNSREAGYNDWRLPTLLELQSTVASSCASAPPLPLINGTAFPNTPTATVFWSATPNASSSTNALALWFKDGSTQTFDRGTGLYVRLVRGGQAFGMLAPAEQFPSFDLVRTVPLRYNGNTQLYGDTYGYSGNPAVFGVSFGQCTVVNANTGFLIAGFNAPAGPPCVVTLNQFGRVANGQNYAQATEVQLNITIGQAW